MVNITFKLQVEIHNIILKIMVYLVSSRAVNFFKNAVRVPVQILYGYPTTRISIISAMASYLYAL